MADDGWRLGDGGFMEGDEQLHYFISIHIRHNQPTHCVMYWDSTLSESYWQNPANSRLSAATLSESTPLDAGPQEYNDGHLMAEVSLARSEVGCFLRLDRWIAGSPVAKYQGEVDLLIFSGLGIQEVQHGTCSFPG